MEKTYSNPRMAAVIDNWPLGHNKRGPAKFTVECHPKRGQRAVRETTGAAKKLTYAQQVRIVDGDDGRTYIAAQHDDCGFVWIMRGDMKYCEETIYADNARYAMARALFD
jgi:hypothetical protein